MDNAVAGPSGAGIKKKRQRVRKKTRDNRKLEMEAWVAAHESTGGIEATTGQEVASETRDGDDEAVVEDKGEVVEIIKSLGEATEPEVNDGASLAGSTLMTPATDSGRDPKTMLRSEHDDILKKLREEAEHYYEAVVKAQAVADSAEEALLKRDNEIKQLKRDINHFEEEIGDPVRGYAVQIKAAENTVKELRAEVSRQKSRASGAEGSRELAEDIKRKLVVRVTELTEEVESKQAEIDTLQRKHEDFDETLVSLTSDSKAEIEELEKELDSYKTYDSNLTKMLDSWLRGINQDTHDTFDKISLLGENLYRARNAAELARRDAQEEIDKRNYEQQTWDFSDITSISQRPIEPPAKSYADSFTQTTREPTVAHSNASTQTTSQPTVSHANASTQALSDPVVSHTSAFTQTSLEPKVSYTGTSTQTVVEPSPVYHHAGTQTIANATCCEAGSQTESAKTHDLQADIQPASSQAESSSKEPRVAKRRVRNPPPPTGAKPKPTFSSTGTQTTPLEIPEVPYWSISSQTSDILLWLLFFLLILFALPGGFSIFSSSSSSKLLGHERPGYMVMDEFESKIFTEDLAKVGFERWLGVDTSWLT